MASAERRQIPLREADLSTYARVRNAALEGFAARGVQATSIRDVAAAAGVSPGLVQHHFGTKSGLREAVDEYVISVALSAFEDLVGDGEEAEVWSAMGDTTTAWVRDNSIAVRYIARALAEDDPEASKVFDALVEIARTRWLEPLARSGALDADVDREWAIMHVILFNFATVLLEPTITRQLGAPFFSPDQLQRWNKATTELYRRGLTKPARKRGRGAA
jgi:AcrR family transcriptional regulator